MKPVFKYQKLQLLKRPNFKLTMFTSSSEGTWKTVASSHHKNNKSIFCSILSTFRLTFHLTFNLQISPSLLFCAKESYFMSKPMWIHKKVFCKSDRYRWLDFPPSECLHQTEAAPVLAAHLRLQNTLFQGKRERPLTGAQLTSCQPQNHKVSIKALYRSWIDTNNLSEMSFSPEEQDCWLTYELLSVFREV